jgi:hypothetical protein
MTDNCEKEECEGCDENVQPVYQCNCCKEPLTLTGWLSGLCEECVREDENGISNAICKKCKRVCPECEHAACDSDGSSLMVTYCYPLSGTQGLDGPLAFQYPGWMCRNCCVTNFGDLCANGHSSPKFGDLCCTICLIACLASAVRGKQLNRFTAEFLLSFMIPKQDDSITDSLANTEWVLYRMRRLPEVVAKQALLKL